MSGSTRSSLKGGASVSAGKMGAGESAGLKQQSSLGRGPLVGAVSPAQRLIKVLVACVLVFTLAPASALAGSADDQHTNSSTTKQKHQSARTQAAIEVPAFGSGYALSPGSGYVGHGSAAVRGLQRRLVRAGEPPGPIDGRFGPRTEQAVVRLQATDGLQEDGIAGPRTLAALSSPSPGLYPGAGYADQGLQAVRVLQRELARAGDPPGPIDGRYGPRTEGAVTRFQAAHRLRADGIAGPRTLALLGAQRTPREVTRRGPSSRPAGLHRGIIHLRGGLSQLQATPPWVRRASASTKAMPSARSTSFSMADLGLLVGLLLALGLPAAWLAYRRRRLESYGGVAAPARGTEQADSIGTPPRPATALDPASIDHQTPVRNRYLHGFQDMTREPRNELGDQRDAMEVYPRGDHLGPPAAEMERTAVLNRERRAEMPTVAGNDGGRDDS